MSNNADEFACIACVDRLKVKVKVKVKVKWKMVVVRGCGVRVIVDISVCWYKCMLV